MAGEPKMVFGSTTTVISVTADLANAANSVAADATQLNNSSLYPYARAVLSIPDGWLAAPTAGSTVDLYMVQDDIDGTSDETPVPAASDILYLGKWVGAWQIDNQDVANLKSINISLHGVEKARFFIYNQTGQTIDYVATAITVKITPFSYAPAA